MWHYKVRKSEVDMWIVTAKCLEWLVEQVCI